MKRILTRSKNFLGKKFFLIFNTWVKKFFWVLKIFTGLKNFVNLEKKLN